MRKMYPVIENNWNYYKQGYFLLSPPIPSDLTFRFPTASILYNRLIKGKQGGVGEREEDTRILL